MPSRQREIDYTSDLDQSIIVGGLGIPEDDIILCLVKAGMNNDIDDDDQEDCCYDPLWDEDIDV